MNGDNSHPIGEENLGKAADPAKVKEQVRKAHSFEARQDDDVFFVLSTRQGRRFLWELLEECNLSRLSFVERNHDQTCFNEGKRNVGLIVLARIMRAHPDSYLKMMTEAKQEENANG